MVKPQQLCESRNRETRQPAVRLAGRSPRLLPRNSSGDSGDLFLLGSGVFLLLCQIDSTLSAAPTCFSTTVTSSHKRLPTVLVLPAEPGQLSGWKETMLLLCHSTKSSRWWQHVCLQKSSWGLNTFNLSPPDSESLFFSLPPLKCCQTTKLKPGQVQAVRGQQYVV